MLIKNYEEVIEKLKHKFVDYLEEKGVNTKRNFHCLSPSHEDKNSSMGLVPQSDFTKAHCFSCGYFADIFDAVNILDNKPKNGPNFVTETVMWLADKYQIQVDLKELTEEEKYRIEIFNAYKAAAFYVASNPSPSALADMERRGWNSAGCRDRMIGGVPSFNEYKSHLKSLGFAVSFLESIDLLNPAMFNENCLIFTVCDKHGRPCGFSSRNLKFNKEDESNNKKYINTSSRNPIYEKSKTLYNIHNTKIEKGTIYLVEGCADAEAMIQAGIINVTATCGTAFTDYHVLELAKAGKTNITCAFDGDKAGIQATEKTIDKLAEHRNFDVYVVNFPDGMDPDEFLKSNGSESFFDLKRWTAFEWKLNSYDEMIEISIIRKEIIPIIANESSPIEREQMIDILSERIDISFDAIKEEVQSILDANERKRQKERDQILSGMMADIRQSPNDWKHILTEAQNGLEGIAERHSEDSFSPSIFLKEINFMKDRQENVEDSGSTSVFHEWPEFQEAIEGNHEATLNVIGGGANCGKTAMMSNMCKQLAESDRDDYFVLFHTIDDTLEQFTTRILTQFALERYPSMNLNKMNNPNKYADARLINDARKYAYSKIERLIREQRLLIRGGEHKGAATLSYAAEMIRYAKKIRPDAKINYFLDNFHRLRDFQNEKDERNRFKKLSNATKDMAKLHKIPVWATMEYNKTVGTGRPTNNSISESIAMEYDANLIMHLYNDMHVKNQLGEEPELFFVRTDSSGNPYKNPRIEAIIGKNKLNSFKGSLFFDFYSDQSRMAPVSRMQVIRDLELQKSMK